MKIRPNFFIIFVFSLLAGAGVLYFFIRALPPESGEGYGVLSVDVAVDDRRISSLLAGAGLENVYSESGQSFFIDDFGAFKLLSLDSYRDSMDELDPRDDGYGERLRSFFARDGRRFFYFPLKDTSNRKRVEQTVTAALGDVLGTGSLSLEILGKAKPVYWYFVIMAAAVTAVFVFSRERLRLVFQIPLFLAFAWPGAAGFVLAGVLITMRGLLAPLLKECFPVRAYGGIGERLGPWKACIILALFFPVFFIAVCLMADIPLGPAITGLVLFLLIEALTVAAERRRRISAAHIRFVPLRILPGFHALPPYKDAAAVFAVGALLAAVLPLFLPAFALPKTGAAASYLRYLPSVEEYGRHMGFQASFSFMPLGRDTEKGEYRHYVLGDDGLVAGGNGAEPQGAISPGEASLEFPPFPLEKLALFLLDYNNSVDTGSARDSVTQLKDIVSVVLLMITIWIPNWFRPGREGGKKKKAALPRDRRIAA